MLNKFENGKCTGTFSESLLKSVMAVCAEYNPNLIEVEESLDSLKLELKKHMVICRTR